MALEGPSHIFRNEWFGANRGPPRSMTAETSRSAWRSHLCVLAGPALHGGVSLFTAGLQFDMIDRDELSRRAVRGRGRCRRWFPTVKTKVEVRNIVLGAR